MKPKEISKIIEKEINCDWSISNAHNCDLKKCLVRPQKRLFIAFGNEIRELWLVLEEYPEAKDGYKVVFDDKTMQFGLAQHNEPKDWFLGVQGNFLDAFKRM